MTDRPLTEEEEDAALCAEYALGLLTPEERRAFDARMAVDPEFRARAILWTEDMAALAATVPEVAPPPGAERAIRARLFPEEGRSLWARLGLLPAMAGGLVAALLVLWAMSTGVLRPDPATAPLGARIAAADGALDVTAALAEDGQTLRLTRAAGVPPEGRVFELWLIPAGQDVPLSLGLLPEGAEGVLPVTAELAALLPGATLAISDEPPGGSPTGQPTGDVRATGIVAPI